MGKYKLDKKTIRGLVQTNPDAHRFFYAKADKRWLDWLWREGFLEALKGKRDKKKDDDNGYDPGTAEITYLERMAGEVPERIVEIILSIQESPNPAVIDYLFRICTKLPARHFAQLVPKIRAEKWVNIRNPSSHYYSEHEYHVIVRNLFNEKEYESMLEFAQAIFIMRSKKEKESRGDPEDRNPFCFKIRSTRIFKYLTGVSDEYTEHTFNVVKEIMVNIIDWGSEENGRSVKSFESNNIFHFRRMDFSTIDLEKRADIHYREVYGVMATFKILAMRLIEQRRDKPDDAGRIYERYFETLPKNNSVMFRFQVYLLSSYPAIFKDKIKHAFFRLFEDEHCHLINDGAEYTSALMRCFPLLSDMDKREYVRQAINYFTYGKSESNEGAINIRDGSEVFIAIECQLTAQERKQIKKLGFSFQPKPKLIARGGWVKPQGPISQEGFERMSISDVAELLRSEWSPQKLSERRIVDYSRPISVLEVGNLLRKDMSNRLQKYVNNSDKFFEPGVLDQHYTYSFLHEIGEIIKSDEKVARKMNWKKLMKLLTVIVDAGKKNDDMEKVCDQVIEWRLIYRTIADVLKIMLDRSILNDFFQRRDSILSIARYLLSSPDPLPRDEIPNTAKIKSRKTWDESIVADPFTIAFNSVRGSAFELLVSFAYKDIEKFKETSEIRIADDVKNLYENVLAKEDTRALMFVFGHFLLSFYRLDKNWIRGLLPKIFPMERKKKDFYTASWEGYLCNILFDPLFSECYMQKLYERGISLTDSDYPNQEHFKHPSEGIASHLAFAFIRDKGNQYQRLFQKLWTRGNVQSQRYFITILGDTLIADPSNDAKEFIKENPEIRQRLLDLWEMLIIRQPKRRKNHISPELFSAFGSWVNPDVDIFDLPRFTYLMKETLEKTKGKLDREYGIVEITPRLAEVAPNETLRIIDLLLLEGYVRDRDGNEMFPHWEQEWRRALKILYNKQETKSGAEALISKLIEEGGQQFWDLEDIGKDEYITKHPSLR